VEERSVRFTKSLIGPSIVLFGLAVPSVSDAQAPASFDGVYSGTVEGPVYDRSGRCPPGARQQNTLTVTGGQASIEWVKSRGITLAGPIGADGTVTMRPVSAGTEVLRGKFDGKTFQGQTEGPNCGYKLTLTKAP
jgi:hypothetical protein